MVVVTDNTAGAGRDRFFNNGTTSSGAYRLDMHYPLTEHFNRVTLAHTPTPLEPLPRLTEHLGGPVNLH